MYRKLWSKFPLLTPEEEIALIQQMKQGDTAARERLILSNMRLVISVARNIKSKTLGFDDLVQEGCIVLIEAAQRFNPKHGTRFATYAYPYIFGYIHRAVDKMDMLVKKPIHWEQYGRKYKQAIIELRNKLMREPTEKEVAQEMGISLEKLQLLKRAVAEPISLDYEIGDEKDKLEEFIANGSNEFEEVEVRIDIENALRKLRPFDQTVIKMVVVEGESLRSAGQKLGVSCQWVNVTKKAALASLRQDLL